MQPEFLSVELVLHLHRMSLDRYGGADGVRDMWQVESAVQAALFTWHYAGQDLFLTGAAYAFHIAESQAFLDGNKRTAVLAAQTFMEGNGQPPLGDELALYEAMILIAEKRLDKRTLATLLQALYEKASKQAR
jgi:death-on-curing protein